MVYKDTGVFGMKFPKFELVGTWREIIKLPSVWLAGIGSSLVAYIMAYPTFLFAVIAFFPPERQFILAILTGLFVLFLVIATRVIKKTPKEEGTDADAPTE